MPITNVPSLSSSVSLSLNKSRGAGGLDAALIHAFVQAGLRSARDRKTFAGRTSQMMKNALVQAWLRSALGRKRPCADLAYPHFLISPAAGCDVRVRCLSFLPWLTCVWQKGTRQTDRRTDGQTIKGLQEGILPSNP